MRSPPPRHGLVAARVARARHRRLIQRHRLRAHLTVSTAVGEYRQRLCGCQRIGSGTRPGTRPYIDILADRGCMVVLPCFTRLTLDKSVRRKDVDRALVAGGCGLGGFLTGLRRLVYAPKAGKSQQQGASAQASRETDTRRGGPVTAAAVVVVATAKSSILQCQKIGGR